MSQAHVLLGTWAFVNTVARQQAKGTSIRPDAGMKEGERIRSRLGSEKRIGWCWPSLLSRWGRWCWRHLYREHYGRSKGGYMLGELRFGQNLGHT